MSTDRYPFREVEAKWQRIWEERKQFQVHEDPSRPKFYCLEMFPYPSGRIHMGHVRVYAIGDLLARYKWMRGYNVLHPMGWDAFGLPAENAAIEHGVHPAIWTYENIDYMRTQLMKMGISYDWDREVTTCDPAYYKWEQLIFIKMLERGLAYRKRSTVNWCPSCQTVLANEQVEDGRCWRCDSEVAPREIDGWFFKITSYADELLAWSDRLPGSLDPRLHDAAGHRLRHDVRGAGPRAPACRPGRDRPCRARGRRAIPRRGRAPVRDRADGRGPAQAGTPPVGPRPESIHRGRRPAVPRRLRRHGLRDRRHHGGPRRGRARLGIRRAARPADHRDGHTS